MKKILLLVLVSVFVGFTTDLQAQKKKKKKGEETAQPAPKKKKNGSKIVQVTFQNSQ